MSLGGRVAAAPQPGEQGLPPVYTTLHPNHHTVTRPKQDVMYFVTRLVTRLLVRCSVPLTPPYTPLHSHQATKVFRIVRVMRVLRIFTSLAHLPPDE
eukprot:scaffold80256_cov42-Phaeocystis_antarctica.AAC.3